MARATQSACLALLFPLTCVWAVRFRETSSEGAAAEAAASTLAHMEYQSLMRTRARFAEAFAEDRQHGGVMQCPYGDDPEAGNENSWACNWFSNEHAGETCPTLQTQRLKIARRFVAATHADFVERAKNFPLKPLFDKSAKVVGDENYEKMVSYQIQGLIHPDVVQVEDKIYLKDTAKRLGIPATKSYFGAHDDDWDAAAFGGAMRKLCVDKVDAFIIKATHLAWSAGQKIVRNWQSVCDGGDDAVTQKVGELVDFIKAEVLGQKASEADMHLRLMKPGVTVEELFVTGGPPNEPLEAKVFVLWGKAHSMLLRGADNRNCKTNIFSWYYYADEDKSGWDFTGALAPGQDGDEIGDRVKSDIFDDMFKHAEIFATDVGADYMRVDFFIGVPVDKQKPLFFALNECESVSGAPAFYDRQGMGEAWRDGYVLRDSWSTTSEKWTSLVEKTQADRDEVHLDSPGGNH